MTRCLPLVLIAVTAWIGHPAAQEVTREYRLKAEYLFNFVKYVDWGAVKGPIRICVAGQNPFHTALDELIKNEKVRGVPVSAQVILEPDPGCHVVFMPRTSNIPAYLRAAAGTPTLTVGETPRFIEQGGVINFVVESDGVRFDISRAAAERAGLRLSSQLLQLARVVDPPPQGP